MNLVPILPVRRVQHFNACALDFFRPGFYKVVGNENGLVSQRLLTVLLLCLLIVFFSAGISQPEAEVHSNDQL